MDKKMPIGLFVAELEAACERKDGYIMGSKGQDPKKWAENSWWFTQYTGSQRSKALYWRKNAERVWDCNGMAEGIYEDWSGVNINTKARYNYASWCPTKGTGMIPVKYRVPGAAVFWGTTASKITHVAYLYKPVDANKPSGDWYIIEARGVSYGVVKTRLNSRKPNFWGLMEKYFDYGNTSSDKVESNVKVDTNVLGSRLLKKGCKGEDVKLLQQYLMKLGYELPKYKDDGDFGGETKDAVEKFQGDYKLEVDGEYGPKSHAAMMKAIANLSFVIIVTGGTVNVRNAPNTTTGKIKYRVSRNAKLNAVGTDAATGWYKLEDGNYISNKYAEKA